MESLVRNRADLGGDLCLEMGSGMMGKRVGVEGLGSLLGLARKSATDALVFKNERFDMAEDMSFIAGSLLVSPGLGAAREFAFEFCRGRNGRGPPIVPGTRRMFLAVSKQREVVLDLGWLQMLSMMLKKVRFVYSAESGLVQNPGDRRRSSALFPILNSSDVV